MPHRYAELMFTAAVQARQEHYGARHDMARYEADNAGFDRLGSSEAAFIAGRDSFYQATVSEAGWPYVQHRGGPPGFLKVLDAKRLAYADFRGNRQYISAGNLSVNDRVALFLVDYQHRRRLKILGRLQSSEVADADPALVAALRPYPYRAAMERIAVITVEAFDWNCSQHITPRYTEAQVHGTVAPLLARIEALQAEVTALQDAARER